MPCLRCEAQPNFHSFKQLGKTTHGYHIFYSKPSLNVEKTFTEDMVNNFISHMDEASENGKWIYLFDATGLDKMEMPNPMLMRRFHKMVQERYKTKLVHIFILNRNWAFELVFNILQPFMSKEHKNLYKFCSTPLILVSEGVPSDIIQNIFSKK